MIAGLPRTSPLVDAKSYLVRIWDQYFQAIVDAVNRSVETLASATVTGQHASLTTTPIQTSPLAAGLYRASYTAQITTAASISSSLTVTLNWIANGVSLAWSGTAMTGNTTTTQQSNVVMMQVDASTTPTYSTSYLSSGTTAMHYTLTVAVEAL